MQFKRLSTPEMLLTLILWIGVVSPAAGISMTIAPSSASLNEGGTLQITCSERSLEPGVDLNSIVVSNFVEGSSTPSPIVGYKYSRTSSQYVKEWTNTDYQRRGNATSTLSSSSNSGDVVFTLPDVRCSDSAQFVCRSFVSGEPYSYTTPPKNITVQGVTQYISIDGARICDPVIEDPYCERCKNFDDPVNGPKPKYARMDEEVVLTCTADVGKPVSQTAIRWYKSTKNSLQQEPIPSANFTREDMTNNPSSCTRQVISTLRYYPGPDDRELRIFCEISRIGQLSQTVAANLPICVSGLIPGGETWILPNNGCTNNLGPVFGSLGAAFLVSVIVALT